MGLFCVAPFGAGLIWAEMPQKRPISLGFISRRQFRCKITPRINQMHAICDHTKNLRDHKMHFPYKCLKIWGRADSARAFYALALTFVDQPKGECP